MLGWRTLQPSDINCPTTAFENILKLSKCSHEIDHGQQDTEGNNEHAQDLLIDPFGEPSAEIAANCAAYHHCQSFRPGNQATNPEDQNAQDGEAGRKQVFDAVGHVKVAEAHDLRDGQKDEPQTNMHLSKDGLLQNIRSG